MSAAARVDHNCWIVDKRLAVTLLCAFAIPVITAFIGVGVLYANVQENTRRIEKMEAIVETIPAMGQDVKWLRRFLERQSDK